MLAMRNLAVTHSWQGLPDESEVLHQCVLEVRKRILGEDHPETLISMSDLGCGLPHGTFRAMSDEIITYKQESFEDVIKKQIDRVKDEL
jgi:hypothetical protein